MSFLKRIFGRKKEQLTLDEMDMMVLQVMQSHGADLERPHLVQHWIYVDSQEAAERGAAELRTIGYSATVEPVEGDSKTWKILSSCDLVLSPAVVRQMRANQTRIAESVGGEYDGWEADHRTSDMTQ